MVKFDFGVVGTVTSVKGNVAYINIPEHGTVRLGLEGLNVLEYVKAICWQIVIARRIHAEILGRELFVTISTGHYVDEAVIYALLPFIEVFGTQGALIQRFKVDNIYKVILVVPLKEGVSV